MERVQFEFENTFSMYKDLGCMCTYLVTTSYLKELILPIALSFLIIEFHTRLVDDMDMRGIM